MEECASTALQLVLGEAENRRGGGSRGGGGEEGGGEGEGVDVDGLKEFMRQVELLPCRVPETDLLEVRGRGVCGGRAGLSMG